MSVCAATAKRLPPADFTLFYHLLSIERCGPQDSGQVRIKVALARGAPDGQIHRRHLYQRQLV
jgi:NADH:ubiquinone oxidoreductase subunit C